MTRTHTRRFEVRDAQRRAVDNPACGVQRAGRTIPFSVLELNLNRRSEWLRLARNAGRGSEALGIRPDVTG